jgi:hypothetical protein
MISLACSLSSNINVNIGVTYSLLAFGLLVQSGSSKSPVFMVDMSLKEMGKNGQEITRTGATQPRWRHQVLW